MSRVKGGIVSRRRHKALLRRAKGYYGAKHRAFRCAKETVERGLVYAYRDRKAKKRQMRRLWIVRINAAARQHGMSYSALMGKLKARHVALDRKALAYLAFTQPEAFARIAQEAAAA
ncbi:MAG: 50S ribosomal protein L20 [Myxococcota bacterium]